LLTYVDKLRHTLTDHSGELSFEEVRELLPTLDVDAKTDEEVSAISFSRLWLARALSSSPNLLSLPCR
jgi:ABC-type Mn2+/Zn2+ transport system ATPase subunit